MAGGSGSSDHLFPTLRRGGRAGRSSPRPPQHCSSSSSARRLLEMKMTGRLDSDIFLFPWLSRSFFLPLPTLLPPSLHPPSFLPFPPHPGTAEPFRKTEVEASSEENGPAQSPPSRLGLAVNPFLGGLALAPAVELGTEGDGLGPAVPSHLPLQLWSGLRLRGPGPGPLLCSGTSQESLPREGRQGFPGDGTESGIK